MQAIIEELVRGIGWAALKLLTAGRYKGGQFEDLQNIVAERCAAVVAIGEAKALVRSALESTVPVHDAESMGEAVRRARALAPAGGTVLLAPACSSFDMFRSYAERGTSTNAAG